MDNTEIARIKPIQDELAAIHLSDLDIIATLGVGGFGRVELVRNRSWLYSLKMIGSTFEKSAQEKLIFVYHMEINVWIT